MTKTTKAKSRYTLPEKSTLLSLNLIVTKIRLIIDMIKIAPSYQFTFFQIRSKYFLSAEHISHKTFYTNIFQARKDQKDQLQV